MEEAAITREEEDAEEEDEEGEPQAKSGFDHRKRMR